MGKTEPKVKSGKLFSNSISPKAKNKYQQYILDCLNIPEKEKLIVVKAPAGTGKTYLNTKWGLDALNRGVYEKIVISRVTMCPKKHQLGFKPGSTNDKFQEWVRPVVDIVMEEKVNINTYNNWVETGIIQYAPFETMQGMTYKNSFIILDEAQNCNMFDIQMITSRIGEGSTFVMIGAPDQSYYNEDNKNGEETDFEKYYSMLQKYKPWNSFTFEIPIECVLRSKIAKEQMMMFEKVKNRGKIKNG